MHERTLKPFGGRTPAVIAGLTICAVLGFLGVGRLVNRFQEQQKALARHLYQRGLGEQQSGKLDLAVQHFRAALGYDPDNFQYQLGLARSLRDSGRTDEAEAYLVSLWERAPQNGAVNLALGRLAARQEKIDKVIQYYHNAIYGVWDSNPEQNRLNAWFELVSVLSRINARAQAQAELIALSLSLPPQPELLMQAADLFAQTQDYDHAFAEYQRVLQIDRTNANAEAGAAEMAFKLGRYRSAERYLENASKTDPHEIQISDMRQISKLILQQDPFSRGLSAQQRSARIRVILKEAGKRLDTCMASQEQASNPVQQSSDLSELRTQWTQMNRRLRRLGAGGESGLADEVMDLVLQVEQQTSNCAPSSQDKALLLLAQGRSGVEQ